MTATADEFHRVKLMLEGASAVRLCCADLRTTVEALQIAERVVRDKFVEDAVYAAKDAYEDTGFEIARHVVASLTDSRPA